MTQTMVNSSLLDRFAAPIKMRLFGVDFDTNHDSQGAMPVQNPIDEQPMAMARRSRKKRKSIVLFGQELVPERRRSAVKKARRSSRTLPAAPLPPPVVKTIDKMEGEEPVFVTRKILECSDVDANQNRLFVPKSDVLWGMLWEEEKREVEGGGSLQVMVVDHRGGMHNLRLKKWPSLNKIVLNGGWRKLAEENRLEAVKDCIELWSFRADAKLCFALNLNRQVQ